MKKCKSWNKTDEFAQMHRFECLVFAYSYCPFSGDVFISGCFFTVHWPFNSISVISIPWQSLMKIPALAGIKLMPFGLRVLIISCLPIQHRQLLICKRPLITYCYVVMIQHTCMHSLIHVCIYKNESEKRIWMKTAKSMHFAVF